MSGCVSVTSLTTASHYIIAKLPPFLQIEFLQPHDTNRNAAPAFTGFLKTRHVRGREGIIEQGQGRGMGWD